MSLITKWLQLRKIKKATKKIKEKSDLEVFLEEELKETAIEYQKAIRERQKLNRLDEAERRIKKLRSSNDEEEQEEDYEDEEEQEEENLVSKLIMGALNKGLSSKRNTTTPGGAPAAPSQLDFLNQLNPFEREMAENWLNKKK